MKKFIIPALTMIVLQAVGSVAVACQNAPRAELVDSLVAPECLVVNAGSKSSVGTICPMPSLVIENRCAKSVVIDKLFVGIEKESKKPAPAIKNAEINADVAMSRSKDIVFGPEGKKCDVLPLLSLPKGQLPECSSVILHQYNVIYLPVTRGAFYLVQGHVENVAPDNELYSVRAEGRLINPDDPDTVLKDEDLFPVMRFK